MSDYSELKRLAEAATPGPWQTELEYPIIQPAYPARGSIASALIWQDANFISAANPAAVLALIAEVEGLRAQHGRDSAELRSLCQARDYARKELGQLKADNEALRKDAERYRFVSQLAWYVDQAAYIYDIGNAKSPWAGERAPVDADDVESAIDAAMGKGAKP